MTLTPEQTFRQWLNKTYGVQDYEAYRGTQTEEIAIQYVNSFKSALREKIEKRQLEEISEFGSIVITPRLKALAEIKDLLDSVTPKP